MGDFSKTVLAKSGMSVADLCAITKQSRQTLDRWMKEKPELLEVVLIGAKQKRGKAIRELDLRLESEFKSLAEFKRIGAPSRKTPRTMAEDMAMDALKKLGLSISVDAYYQNKLNKD